MEPPGSERRRHIREIDAFRIRGAASSATLGLALPRRSSARDDGAGAHGSSYGRRVVRSGPAAVQRPGPGTGKELRCKRSLGEAKQVAIDLSYDVA
jgi:hypothetical protein